MGGARLPLPVRGAALEFLLVFGGIIFVRKELYWQASWLMLDWSQAVACLAALAHGATGTLLSTSYVSPLRKRALKWAVPLTLFMYVACAALSAKLRFGSLAGAGWTYAGATLLAASVGLNVWSCLSQPRPLKEAGVESVRQDSVPSEPEPPPASSSGLDASAPPMVHSRSPLALLSPSGPWKLVRYPERLAFIVFLSGLTLVLGSWLPLLALPGVFVLFKWEIQDLESFRISQLGDAYLPYKRRSWALIPFVY